MGEPGGSAQEHRFTREETYARIRRPVALAGDAAPGGVHLRDVLRDRTGPGSRSGWVAVGCSAQLRDPGDVIVCDVGPRSVFVVRKRDGDLRAYYNVCRHRGTQLLQAGETHVDRFIRCPYHSWAYDHDGACVGTPLFDGSEIPADQRAAFDMEDVAAFDRADYGLLPVAVEEWGPLVFVALDSDAGPLADQLGDLTGRAAGYRLSEWELARTAEYRIAADYKLVAENFMEYYHLPWIHPGLVKISPIEAHHRWQGSGMYVGFCTSPIAADTGDGGWGSGLASLDGLDPEDAISARFAWLFPNLAINILPNHLFVILARPVTPRLTHETTYLLTHPSSTSNPEAASAIDDLTRFWDTVNREDIEIVERVQRGLDSTPFPGGRLCYRFEESLNRFQGMIADRMVRRHRIPPGDDAGDAPMFSRSTRASTRPGAPGAPHPRR